MTCGIIIGVFLFVTAYGIVKFVKCCAGDENAD